MEATLMSVANDWSTAPVEASSLPMPATTPHRPWHRIAEVRRQQGISIRSMTRRLGLTADEVLRQEDPSTDLTLSQLCQWQQALEVPLANLLMDLDAPLSNPVLTRARMLRVMKTVRALQEIAPDEGTERMTTMLTEQLLEVMPELQEVAAWHSVGQRRTKDEMGRIAEQPVSDNFVQDSLR